MVSRPEQAFHMQVARFLELALPPDAWYSTIGHGGGGALRGRLLKAMGMRAGVPDILLVYHGLAHFLELKAPHGRPSQAQIDTLVYLQRGGCQRYAICRTLPEVEGTLLGWGIQLRATCIEAAARAVA